MNVVKLLSNYAYGAVRLISKGSNSDFCLLTSDFCS